MNCLMKCLAWCARDCAKCHLQAPNPKHYISLYTWPFEMILEPKINSTLQTPTLMFPNFWFESKLTFKINHDEIKFLYIFGNFTKCPKISKLHNFFSFHFLDLRPLIWSWRILYPLSMHVKFVHFFNKKWRSYEFLKLNLMSFHT